MVGCCAVVLLLLAEVAVVVACAAAAELSEPCPFVWGSWNGGVAVGAAREHREVLPFLGCRKWGVTNGVRCVWPPFLEIGLFRPFCRFPEGPKSTWKIQETQEKGLLIFPSDTLGFA